MTYKLTRPALKKANTKVSESDMIYFSLGIDATTDFILPSERDDYRSDDRAVQLIRDIQAGKDMSGQDFTGINLKNADISGGHFKGASFKGALFYKTKATDCDFTDCDFTEAYMEETDFSRSWFTGASFKKSYLRHLKLDDAHLDEDALRRITAMDKLIDLINSGEIDIRSLTESDLLFLDLRRLDLSKVDLSDMDLSMFSLEGVNLRGVYIPPGVLLSLKELKYNYMRVQALNEKRLKAETLKVLNQKKEELEAYAKSEAQNKADIQKAVVPTKNVKRPPLKQDEFESPEKTTSSFKNHKKTETDDVNMHPKKTENEPQKPILRTRLRHLAKTKKVKARN